MPRGMRGVMTATTVFKQTPALTDVLRHPAAMVTYKRELRTVRMGTAWIPTYAPTTVELLVVVTGFVVRT
jgi:hypothetical protein